MVPGLATILSQAAGDVVAARGRHAAHRSDQSAFCFLDLLHLLEDFLRRRHGAAGRVDAHDDRFDPGHLFKSSQLGEHLARIVDGARRSAKRRRRRRRTATKPCVAAGEIGEKENRRRTPPEQIPNKIPRPRRIGCFLPCSIDMRYDLLRGYPSPFSPACASSSRSSRSSSPRSDSKENRPPSFSRFKITFHLLALFSAAQRSDAQADFSIGQIDADDFGFHLVADFI